MLAFVALAAALGLAGCGTTHPLPPYERPLARAEYQIVRTTAYTHTESDHLAYGNHNAIGGVLRAAGAPGPAPSMAADAAAPPFGNGQAAYGFQRGAYIRPVANFTAPSPGAAVCGSAAADWSRWPVGTVFQLASTGQIYRVDDYGWALAGRNTIDLYQPTRAAMNAWGVRRESLHVLRWGSKEESLRRLRGHQGYRHIKRMVLELEGRDRAAARLD